MRHHSGRGLLSCSYCNKNLRKDRVDVMGFRLHRVCADNIANVLDKVRAFNEWKRTHPPVRPFELTA
jgi:hypothetical protein